MRNNVSAGGKYGAARQIAAFGGGARDFDFRHIRGERAVAQCGYSEQHYERDSAEDNASRPCGRPSTSVTQRMIDAQAPQVVVLGVDRSEIRGHGGRYAPNRLLVQNLVIRITLAY